jgi:hypothetical protein
MANRVSGNITSHSSGQRYALPLSSSVIENSKMRVLVFIFLILVTQLSHSEYNAKIFNDKEKGYFIKYPSDWIAGVYRSGVVVANVSNRQNDTGISIRLYDYDGNEDSFIQRYVKSVESDLSIKLRDRENGYVSGQAFIDLKFSPVFRGSSFEHIHRIHLFHEQNVALVMQAGCPADNAIQLIPVLVQSLDSLWVYNKAKLRK